MDSRSVDHHTPTLTATGTFEPLKFGPEGVVLPSSKNTLRSVSITSVEPLNFKTVDVTVEPHVNSIRSSRVSKGSGFDALSMNPFSGSECLGNEEVSESVTVEM